MTAYIIRRLLYMIPVLIMVTMSVFFLLQLTGDPIRMFISTGVDLDAEQIEVLRHELGLDRSLPVQYGMWLGRALQGDLGRSTHTGRLVTDELKARLPVTFQLGIISWIISGIIAIPLGIIAAVYRGSKLDMFATVTAISGVAVPSFWLGIMLILLFSVALRWLPPCGWVNLWDNPIESLRYMAMPVLSLSLAGAALNMRQTRSAMLEVLMQDYIRTARAKGLSERTVIWLHAFKNACLPVVTQMGLQVGRLFGGVVIIETVFMIPGMGRMMVTAIFGRDFLLVQGGVLIIALFIVFANLVTDLLYAYLDPRIRYR